MDLIIKRDRDRIRSAAIVLSLAAFAFGIASCGGSSVADPNTNSAQNKNIGQVSNSAVNGADPVTTVPNSVADAVSQGNANRRTVTESADASAPAPPNAKPLSIPAPDDSEYSMQLTDVALEVRTFRKHPQLFKVEKSITPTEQKVKVFLRDGRVIDVPAQKINSMKNDPASVFLAAAGIGQTPQAPKPQDREKQGARGQ